MEALRVVERNGTNPRAATSRERTRIMDAIAQESMIRSRSQTLPDSVYQELVMHVRAASIAVFDGSPSTIYVILWDEESRSVTVLAENAGGDLVVVADMT